MRRSFESCDRYCLASWRLASLASSVAKAGPKMAPHDSPYSVAVLFVFLTVSWLDLRAFSLTAYTYSFNSCCSILLTRSSSAFALVSSMSRKAFLSSSFNRLTRFCKVYTSLQTIFLDCLSLTRFVKSKDLYMDFDYSLTLSVFDPDSEASDFYGVKSSGDPVLLIPLRLHIISLIICAASWSAFCLMNLFVFLRKDIR